MACHKLKAKEKEKKKKPKHKEFKGVANTLLQVWVTDQYPLCTR